MNKIKTILLGIAFLVFAAVTLLGLVTVNEFCQNNKNLINECGYYYSTLVIGVLGAGGCIYLIFQINKPPKEENDET